jgi:NAD(P)H-flavin reductase
MFSGPHGQVLPVGKYETVMMVADGVGIAAQLPYLKSLIHGYHARRVVTRRIHLVWQIDSLGKGQKL